MRCDHCGLESTLDSAFVRTRRSFRRGLYTFCPACARRPEEIVQRLTLLATTIVLAGAAVIGLLNRRALDREPFAFLVNTYLVSLFMYLSIVPHELGHARGARLAGLRVFQITIGIGRRLLEFSVHDTRVEVRLVPLVGYVLAARPDNAGWRWRTFFFIVMGPASNAALFTVALLRIVPGDLLPYDHVLSSVLPWHALAAANVWLLILSLYPHSVATPIGPCPSDGRNLLHALAGPVPTAAATRARYHTLAAISAIASRRYPDAIRMCEQGLSESPEQLDLTALRAGAEIVLRRYEAARGHLLDVLSRFDGPREGRTMLQNNLAWTCLMCDPPRLDEADAASREAIEALPWNVYCQGTRGNVLVEMGLLAEAEPLLRRAVTASESPEQRASNLCGLALLSLRRGDASEARRLLRTAERDDPLSELLPRVRAALEAAHPQTAPAAVR